MSIENDLNIPTMVEATSQGHSYSVQIHKIPSNEPTCSGCLFETKDTCHEMQCGIGQPKQQQYIYVIGDDN